MPQSNETLSRRDWLRFAAAPALLPLSSWILPRLALAAPRNDSQRSLAKGKGCIMIFMKGGLSQHHTFFVPERDQPVPTIETSVPGIRIAESFPSFAKQMHHVALLRGMSTGNSNHEAADHLMHTGYLPNPSVRRPSTGNVASEQLGRLDADLPNFVYIVGGSVDGLGVRPHRPHPGYVGARHAPVTVEDPGRGLEFMQPGVGMAEFDASANLINQLNRRYLDTYQSPGAGSQHAATQKALQLLHSNKAGAFDLGKESPATIEAYGTAHSFGKACLLARRLVEFGVPFVEIMVNGWDDHGGAQKKIPGRTYIDQGMASLLADLHDRGMLESTLVMCLSEFGRTPNLGTGYNQSLGSGHYAKAWTAWMAGGGIKGGQVIGKTDDGGAEVIERPISAQEFHATVCQSLGLDPRKQYETPDGRPMQYLENSAKPIAELF